jgi:uncharacterized protein (DUF58 family)
VKYDYQQLLKPEIVKTVSGLGLISRIIVDGYMSGIHQSRRVGAGMEFSQYRSYQSGDDPRLLDWKLLARSGRYYIKQAEIDTHITVKFIVDSSASMLHEESGISKMDYARILVATLAYLSYNQGDMVGLFALNERQLIRLYPKLEKKHYNRLLQGLLDIKSEGAWPKNKNETKPIHSAGQKELLFFITDMYETSGELSDFIGKLKTPRNEVIVLQIMGKEELEFNYKNAVTFEDLETGARVKVEAKEAKRNYMKAMELLLQSTREMMLSHGINYHVFQLDTPFGDALRFFLKKRNNLL